MGKDYRTTGPRTTGPKRESRSKRRPVRRSLDEGGTPNAERRIGEESELVLVIVIVLVFGKIDYEQEHEPDYEVDFAAKPA